MIIWARCPRVVSPSNAEKGTSMATQLPLASAGSDAWVNEISCSTSSPPPHAPSAPKSTSLTRNAAGSAVGSGVQTSMCKWVMFEASTVAEVNSMPAKARFVYFFTSSPPI